MTEFSYATAFSRNIGWVTDTEQSLFRTKKIAIGGLGGVGGSYLLALTRLGIQNFTISDLDEFDLSNFNRQVGANLSTIHQKKCAVMTKMAKEINPDANITVFDKGITDQNYISFLENADLFLDSLDLYALPLKMKIFNYCYENKIPIVSAAPIGMSTSLLVITKDSMSPSDYFGIPENDPIEKQIIRFLLGINPSMRSIKNLVQSNGVHLKGKKLPSLVIGIELCTAVVCSTVVKILLNRGTIVKAPSSSHFDAFENKHYITRRPFGYKNPLQQIMYYILKRIYLK